MSWRTAVNARLLRLTGYHLSRPRPPAPARTQPATAQPARTQPAKKPAATAQPADKQPADAQPAPAEKKKSRSAKYVLHPDFDAESKEIIQSVRGRTMTDSEKLFGLISAVRYVQRHEIPGDIVECGVWRGGSMQAAAKTLLSCGGMDRDLYLFDTFEGMPPPTEEDRRRDGRSAQDLLDSSDRSAAVWAVATLEDVQKGMAEVDYPADRIHYAKGLVEDTVPAQAPEQISILRLDTDWYASTRHELDHLYPRLSPGGVLILDDYGYWHGARQAVDEFLDATDARLLLARASAGRIAVKP